MIPTHAHACPPPALPALFPLPATSRTPPSLSASAGAADPHRATSTAHCPALPRPGSGSQLALQLAASLFILFQFFSHIHKHKNRTTWMLHTWWLPSAIIFVTTAQQPSISFLFHIACLEITCQKLCRVCGGGEAMCLIGVAGQKESVPSVLKVSANVTTSLCSAGVVGAATQAAGLPRMLVLLGGCH